MVRTMKLECFSFYFYGGNAMDEREVFEGLGCLVFGLTDDLRVFLSFLTRS